MPLPTQPTIVQPVGAPTGKPFTIGGECSRCVLTQRGRDPPPLGERHQLPRPDLANLATRSLERLASQFQPGRERPFSAHPFRSRSLRRRSANRTDTGPSAYAAGTGQSAPKPTPMITLTNDEVGSKADLTFRHSDRRSRPTSGERLAMARLQRAPVDFGARDRRLRRKRP
jgi:hypothetical protein